MGKAQFEPSWRSSQNEGGSAEPHRAAADGVSLGVAAFSGSPLKSSMATSLRVSTAFLMVDSGKSSIFSASSMPARGPGQHTDGRGGETRRKKPNSCNNAEQNIAGRAAPSVASKRQQHPNLANLSLLSATNQTRPFSTPVLRAHGPAPLDSASESKPP